MKKDFLSESGKIGTNLVKNGYNNQELLKIYFPILEKHKNICVKFGMFTKTAVALSAVKMIRDT